MLAKILLLIGLLRLGLQMEPSLSDTLMVFKLIHSLTLKGRKILNLQRLHLQITPRHKMLQITLRHQMLHKLLTVDQLIQLRLFLIHQIKKLKSLQLQMKLRYLMMLKILKCPMLLPMCQTWTGLSFKRLTDFVVTPPRSLNSSMICSSTLMVIFFGCLAKMVLEHMRVLMPSLKPLDIFKK